MDDSAPYQLSRHWSALPRPVHVGLAVILCALTTLFALIWMYDRRHPNPHTVEIGFNANRATFYDPATSSIPIYSVSRGSPAEQAGLRAGDQIIALDGHRVTSYRTFDTLWTHSHPGDAVEVTVRRPGESQPITCRALFRAVAINEPAEGFARTSAEEILGLYPIFFLLVGFAVLFLRVEDNHAWLLAVLFSAFVGVAGFSNVQSLPMTLQRFALVYRSIASSLLTPLFYVFFAVFPEKSPLEKRAPWLKWVALAIGVSQLFRGMLNGDPHWPAFVAQLIGESGSEYLRHALTYSLVVLGIVSLIWNCYGRETSPEARRKSRVLLGGTLVGVFPIVLERIITDFSGYRPPMWVDRVLNVLLLLYPLSFAYAVVKHRVLEIPALLRRSARYVLVQRGYFVLLFCAALLTIFLFTHFFSGVFVGNSQFGMVLSAAFGVAMVWVSGPLVKRGTNRIDRAFFRSSYDARVILQDLAEKARTVTNRHELARLLELHIADALNPKSLACYLETGDGNLTAEPGTVAKKAGRIAFALPRPRMPYRLGARFVLRDAPTIAATLPLLVELAQRGKAWDVPPPAADETGENAALTPECLVPIVGRNTKLMGLLVLGPRLSEEPYSSEDKSLLESVASQAAISLENMTMAEQIADRLELDRRAEREMQIARDVQSRLFPQVTPQLKTLEYAGSCLQARQVGGDYYDFLDLGSSRVALVLADISGKGIAGALLMANLQANLRSRYEVAVDDLPRLLKSVNQLFHENTPEDRYATMFLGVYDGDSRTLTYANCGQNPPLLFRADGRIEKLAATATVIGLFPRWECTTENLVLCAGDVLVIYTDGATEANDADGNEFGEERLKHTVQDNLQNSPGEILTAIQNAVQRFSFGEQFDDLTLVVARVR